MSDIQATKITQFTLPVTTGTIRSAAPQTVQKETGAVSFQELLRQRLEENSNVAFSKHAVNRVVERNIDLSGTNVERLNEGVRLAEEKGLKEPLILVGNTAFIVSVVNNTVITTVEGKELQGSVFTNIDGTVIV